MERSTTNSGHFSRPPNRDAHDSEIDQIAPYAKTCFGHLQDAFLPPLSVFEATIFEGMYSCSSAPGLTSIQGLGI